MQITEALIERFFAGDCTTTEAIAVHAYLSANPDILEKLLQKDWNNTKDEKSLSHAEYQDMLEAVMAGAFGKKKPFIKRPLVWMSAAASVIIIVMAWWLLPAKQAPVVAERKIDPWKSFVNTTSTAVSITLQDGSVVTLSPNTKVRYRETFADNKRDIWLRGEAFFEVAKDKDRPFTVYAGAMATTALGTSFSVAENQEGCIVKLHSGKVMVQAIDQSVGPVVLLPGQQMQYNAGKRTVAVNTFGQPSVSHNKNSISIHKYDIAFDNTPLHEVMEEVGKYYHVSIDYNKDEIAGMYFTGTILKKDPAAVILRVIGQMNGLAVEEGAGGFVLKKSQQ